MSDYKKQKCPVCGKDEWIIMRDVDCLVAKCVGCFGHGVAYDIGWSVKGYVSEEEYLANVQLLESGLPSKKFHPKDAVL